MPTAIEEFCQALIRNSGSFEIELSAADVYRLGQYYELLLKWNPRLHLVAPCTPTEFATRHVLESLLLLQHLSAAANIVDVGSGAGLPIIPCLIVRADLKATMIESSPKKIVFLHEALRGIDLPERACLITDRFENIRSPAADFVTCRALDRFQEMLPRLITWSPPGATLLIFAGEELKKQIESGRPLSVIQRIPGSERRFLLMFTAEDPVTDS